MCVASIAIWIGSVFFSWSYTRPHDAEWNRVVEIGPGYINGMLIGPPGFVDYGARFHRRTVGVSTRNFFLLSFGLPSVAGPEWVVPLWFPSLLFAALPLGRLFKRTRSRKRYDGR